MRIALDHQCFPYCMQCLGSHGVFSPSQLPVLIATAQDAYTLGQVDRCAARGQRFLQGNRGQCLCCCRLASSQAEPRRKTPDFSSKDERGGSNADSWARNKSGIQLGVGKGLMPRR